MIKNYLILFGASLITIFGSACSTTQYDDSKSTKIEGTKYLGKNRITYYTAHEDKYGSRVAAPGVRRAQQGLTVAAHPNFPFGTTVLIPELKSLNSTGIFVTQDRGGAVTRCKASQGKTYVWDIFLNIKNKAMREYQRTHSLYMDVYVMNTPIIPSSDYENPFSKKRKRLNIAKN